MILFPADTIERAEVERDYRTELEAAQSAGFSTSFFDFDALRRGEPIERILRRVPAVEITQTAIYRGWMLAAPDYARLFDGLQARGWKLINDAAMYRFGHHAPENYDFWREWMPQTVWIERAEFESNGEVVFKPIFEVLKTFGNPPVIVKDWVKSQKHRWDEACFIPDAGDEKQVRRVVSRFLELQGEYLTGGLVFRRFERLRGDANGHSFEWRSFWLDGELLSLSANPHGEEPPSMEAVKDLVRSCPSRFFTLDFAQRESGAWVIIEMGDGGVSGLPPSQNVADFYASVLLPRLI